MRLSETAEYRAYISSPEWAEKREEKYRQVGRKCQECGMTERLEVHHLSYDRFGHERLEDLQVLCHWCHMFEHGRGATGFPAAGPNLKEMAHDARDREGLAEQHAIVLAAAKLMTATEQIFEEALGVTDDPRFYEHAKAIRRHAVRLARYAQSR